MQFEDSNGCLWTQHKDEHGTVYYFNTNTQESTWELPGSAGEVGEATARSLHPTTALVPLPDSSACWTQIVDDSTNTSYFLNTSTQECVWELGPQQRSASGIYATESESGDCYYEGTHESKDDFSWISQILDDFRVPSEVSEAVGKAGSSHVWPLQTADDQPSRLQRWNVLKAADPYREHFAPGDAWRQEHPEFEPKLCFYAFDAAVEHVERYWVEEAEAPFRCRLQRKGLKFSRDVAKWEKRADPTLASARETLERPDDATNDKRGEIGLIGGPEGGNCEAGKEADGFFAFPLVVNSSHAHHVDWTSGPDRYQISQGAEPEWGWTRLFTFFAYAASKYHVMETTENPLAQKIVKGYFLEPERGWKCVLAFYAFDEELPGSNRYYVEEKHELHYRTRIGMEPSCRWEPRHSFAAFDVPVPGSCALDVHYTIRSADSLNPYPEQCRISLKDPWGPWEQKFRFYAFPATYVLLTNAKEDNDGDEQDWSALTAGTMPASDIS